jgi:cytochrome c oxidase subunit 3
LLSSGATVTFAHHSLIHGERTGALYGSIATLLLAIIFTAFQGLEYSVSPFTISDGAFGTCFFFGKGFHGLHVIIVTIFLGVSFLRIFAYHSTNNHHLGFEGGILY